MDKSTVLSIPQEKMWVMQSNTTWEIPMWSKIEDDYYYFYLCVRGRKNVECLDCNYKYFWTVNEGYEKFGTYLGVNCPNCNSTNLIRKDV